MRWSVGFIKGVRWLEAFSAWLSLYIAFGGAAGFFFDAPYTTGVTCIPFTSLFGVLATNCPNQAITLFWNVFVVWPRLVIVFPAISTSLFRAAIPGDLHWAVDGLWWLLLSVPLLVIIWLGGRYWRRRGAIVSWAIALAVVAEFATLGFME